MSEKRPSSSGSNGSDLNNKTKRCNDEGMPCQPLPHIEKEVAEPVAEGPAIVAPEPKRRAQPWKELLDAEMRSGNNPWLNWKPNPSNFGEKPWLDINWHQTGERERHNQSPQMISGYATGNLGGFETWKALVTFS